MAKSKIYRGISFVNYKKRKTLSLSDKNLVNQDLLNHIFTRVGERIMMPTFGTHIPDMPFEPLDELLLDILQEDLYTVVLYDPRVSLRTDVFSYGIKLEPLYDENAVIASIDLNYIELDLSETLDIRLEFNT